MSLLKSSGELRGELRGESRGDILGELVGELAFDMDFSFGSAGRLTVRSSSELSESASLMAPASFLYPEACHLYLVRPLTPAPVRRWARPRLERSCFFVFLALT